MWFHIVLILCVSFVFYWFYHFIIFYKHLKTIPGPKVWPVFGNILEFTDGQRLMHVVDKIMKSLKTKSMRLHNFFRTVIFTEDYKLIESILSSHSEIHKGDEYECIKGWMGEGVFLTNGPSWRYQRKILMPALYVKNYLDFTDVIVANADLLASKLKDTIGQQRVDVFPFCTSCALDIICEKGMGVKLNAQKGENVEYVRAIYKINSISAERYMKPIYRNPITYKWTNKCKQEQMVMNTINYYTDLFIKSRKEAQQKEIENLDLNNDDLDKPKKKLLYLDMLIQARRDGEPLPHQLIRDDLNVYLFGGHDTTSTTLAFAMFEFAKHPEIQQKAYEEIRGIFENDPTRSCTFTDTQQMKYLDGVIKETLRMYPPAVFVSRRLQENLTVDGVTYPKDLDIAICVYGVHHNETYYPDPKKFDPDRFAVDNQDTKRPFSFLPFSQGPRNCPGQKYAMFEMRIILSTILRKFEIIPATPTHNLDLINDMIIRSANGICVAFKNRD